MLHSDLLYPCFACSVGIKEALREGLYFTVGVFVHPGEFVSFTSSFTTRVQGDVFA